MSQQAIVNLVQRAQTDQVLSGELQAAKTIEEKAAVAVHHGFDVRVEDLAALRDLAEKEGGGGELSDAELELVAGGGIFGRIWSWAKEHLTGSGGDVKSIGVKGTHDVGGGGQK